MTYRLSSSSLLLRGRCRSSISCSFLYGEAKVLSVFERVVNLETQEGWCVTLAPLSFATSPNRILLPSGTLAEMRLRPEESVEVSPGVLKTGRGSYLLEHWPLQAERDRLPSVEVFEAYARALSRHGVGAVQALFGSSEELPIAESAVAERSDGLPRPDAAAGLLGLGGGYTPSGDDVLTGYLVTATLFTGAVPEGLKGIGLEARRKTTPLSATMIRCAEGGLTTSTLLRVLGAIAEADPGLDRLVASYIDSVGHSSGSDTLLGVYLAFRGLVGR